MGGLKLILDGFVSNSGRWVRFLSLSVMFVLLFGTVRSVNGELRKMSTEQMSEVVGRTNLLDLTVETGSTDYSGSFTSDCGLICGSNTTDFTINNKDLTFVRLKANAEITGEAIDSNNPAIGFDTAKVGHYDNTYQRYGGGYVTSSGDDAVSSGDSFFNDGVDDGNGWLRQNNSSAGSDDWDNDFQNAEIGPQGASQRPVLKGPYVEFAVRDRGTDNQELVGVRVGVTAARGTVRLDMTDNYATGSVASRGCVLFDSTCQNLVSSGHRWKESTLGVNMIQFLSAMQLGDNSGPEGNNNGWTEDFWISINKEDVFYEYQNPAYDVAQGGSPPPDCAEGCGDDPYMIQNTDGKGFWIHLRDDNHADAALF